MKDLKKYELDVEELKNVSGGAGEDWDEILRRINNNNEQIDVSIQNQSYSEPFFPHSKKLKGKLYK